MGPLVLLTDFGAQDGYVGIMKGVMAGIAPGVLVIDLSHQIPPQDLMAAKFVLWNSYRFFPQGSLFVVVVDPGVGSGRHILALEAGGYRFIAPDNGVRDYVLAETRVKHFLRIEEKKLMRSEISQTFHGRDIFAPVAAKISAGYPFTTVGPAHPYQLPDSPWLSPEGFPIEGEIVYIDHFGNLITNLKAGGLSTGIAVRINGITLPLVTSYASVEEGQLLALEGSHGLLEIAQRNGSAAKTLGAGYGEKVVLKG